MKKIKLIAIDIGGTLITDDNEIPEANLNAIINAKAKGISISLITARMYSSTKYISKNIGADYGVFSNGSIVMNLNNMSIYKEEYIPKELIPELIDFAKENDIYIHINRPFVEFSDRDEYFVLKHRLLNEDYPDELKSNILLVDNLKKYCESINDIVKVVFVSEQNLDGFVEKFKKKFPQLHITEYYRNSNETTIGKIINYVEVGIKNSTKCDGLERLIDELGIEKDETLVIGDGENDLDMFSKFKVSGCLNNGTNAAKKISNYVSTKTNNEAGLAEIISHFIERG